MFLEQNDGYKRSGTLQSEAEIPNSIPKQDGITPLGSGDIPTNSRHLIQLWPRKLTAGELAAFGQFSSSVEEISNDGVPTMTFPESRAMSSPLGIYEFASDPVPRGASPSIVPPGEKGETEMSSEESGIGDSINVLPRVQKLIHKGNFLEGSGTLKSAGISKGSKIMLMASQGLHQGDGPKLKDAPVMSNYWKVMESSDRKVNKSTTEEAPVQKSRSERWKVTGVVALSEFHLKDIPDEVWVCGSAARVLDLSNNYISNVPTKISGLAALQKLLLNSNQLSDDTISWEGLGLLKSLTFLSLNQNQLTTLPAAMGALTSLTQLHLAYNKLTSLPDEIGALTQLQILKVNNSRISNIPTNFGNCQSLTEVDLSSNLLVELPDTFCNLINLKALHLRNNGTKSLPSTLFKKCIKLSTLDLHGTLITIDMLRQAEGWDEFDERRAVDA